MRCEFLQEQKFDSAIIRKMSCRQDARIVQNEQVTVPPKIFEIGEPGMLNRLSVTVEDEHARVLPTRERTLRD
jgi:hypothetical protein